MWKKEPVFLTAFCYTCLHAWPLQITKEDVVRFQSDTARFNQKFMSEGPGTVGMDLDKGIMDVCVCMSVGMTVLILLSLWPASPGVKLLNQFRMELSVMESRRQELTNAEKLFDLPITRYPDMMEVDQQMRYLTQVLELYEAQRVSQVCACV